MKEIWFHDLFETQRQETLSLLLTGKYGYVDSNPGPVVAYPPNLGLFPVGMPEMLAPGTQLAIPWTRARLEKMIRLDGELMKGKRDAAVNAAKALTKNAGEMNVIEQRVDVAGEVVMLLFGIGSLARVTRGAMKGTAAQAAKIAREVKDAGMFVGMAGVGVTAGLDPTVYTGKGALWQNLTRHAMSLTSPSYWGALAASVWTGEWDLWKYGSEGMKDRDVARVMKNFTKEASEIAVRMAAMERQHKMKFYDYRVMQSETVHTVPGWMQAAS